MLLNFQYQQVVKRNGGVYDISPKSNELCTNVQVELTIPLAVLGRGMGVKSFKMIQILTESPALSNISNVENYHLIRIVAIIISLISNAQPVEFVF